MPSVANKSHARNIVFELESATSFFASVSVPIRWTMNVMKTSSPAPSPNTGSSGMWRYPGSSAPQGTTWGPSRHPGKRLPVWPSTAGCFSLFRGRGRSFGEQPVDGKESMPPARLRTGTSAGGDGRGAWGDRVKRVRRRQAETGIGGTSRLVARRAEKPHCRASIRSDKRRTSLSRASPSARLTAEWLPSRPAAGAWFFRCGSCRPTHRTYGDEWNPVAGCRWMRGGPLSFGRRGFSRCRGYPGDDGHAGRAGTDSRVRGGIAPAEAARGIRQRPVPDAPLGRACGYAAWSDCRVPGRASTRNGRALRRLSGESAFEPLSVSFLRFRTLRKSCAVS